MSQGLVCVPGLIEVWIILLEQLTAAVSNCPRQHQPPTLDLLFELLRDVTKTPGKYFYVYQKGPTYFTAVALDSIIGAQ